MSVNILYVIRHYGQKKIKIYHSTDIIVSSCCHKFEKPHTKQSRGQRRFWDRQECVCVCKTEVGQGEKEGTNAAALYLAEELLFPGWGKMGKVDGLPSWALWVNLPKVHNCSVMQIHIKMLQSTSCKDTHTHINMLGIYVYILVCICMLGCYRFIAQKCSPAHGWSPSRCNDHYSQADLISRGFIADSRIVSLSPPPISVWFCALPPVYVFTAFQWEITDRT